MDPRNRILNITEAVKENSVIDPLKTITEENLIGIDHQRPYFELYRRKMPVDTKYAIDDADAVVKKALDELLRVVLRDARQHMLSEGVGGDEYLVAISSETEHWDMNLIATLYVRKS
jgi:hypothetical protein